MFVFACFYSYCGGFLDGEPPRASGLARQGAPAGEYLGLVVYVACLFYRGGFLGGEPPRASVLARQGTPAGEYLGLVVYVACLFSRRGFLRFATASVEMTACAQ